MRKNLAKHTAKKLPLAKRVLALCFALIFVCSCLLPAFANGTGAELETPDTEVVEAAAPGAEPEPMDLYDEPAAVADEPTALGDNFAVADEPEAMDDDFAVADEPAAMDDQVEKPVVDNEPAAMDDQVEKPVVDDEPAAMDNEVEKPVEGGEPPVADDTPAKEGATKTTTDANDNIVYEYDTSGTTFPDDDAAALPDGDQMQVDAAFSIPTNIYHFWLKKMSSYDLADIADAAKTAEMTVEQYLAMYGTEKGCYHIMTAADGANLKDYQFADPTSNDDPEGNSRTFAGWYYTDELGDEQKFVFDEFLYISEGTTVEVYAKWTDEEKVEEPTTVDVTGNATVDYDSSVNIAVKVAGMPEDTKSLSVAVMDDDAMESFYEVYSASLNDESEALMPLIGFNITPKDDVGVKVQPTTAVTVTISDLTELGLEDDEKLKVLHQTASGVETLDAEYNNGTLTFKTDSFSDFVLAIPQESAVSTLELTGEDTVKVGSTITLSGTNNRNRDCSYTQTWTSSNRSFATVDSFGRVTGVAAGNVTISHTYCLTSGRHYYHSVYTETKTITVEATSTGGTDTPLYLYVLKPGRQWSESNTYKDNSNWFGVGVATVKVADMLQFTGAKGQDAVSAAITNGTVDLTAFNGEFKHRYFYNGSNGLVLHPWGKTFDATYTGKKLYPNLCPDHGAVSGTSHSDGNGGQCTKSYTYWDGTGTKPTNYYEITWVHLVQSGGAPSSTYNEQPVTDGGWATIHLDGIAHFSNTYKVEFRVKEPGSSAFETLDPKIYSAEVDPGTNESQIVRPEQQRGSDTYDIYGTTVEHRGYTFKGWYKDEECTQRADFTEDIHEDKVYYGKWETNNSDVVLTKNVTGIFGDKDKAFNFTVTFSKGGNLETQEVTLKNGESTTFAGVVAGTIITIEETNADGYDTSATGYNVLATKSFTYTLVKNSDGTFSLKNENNEDVLNRTVIVTNEKDAPVDNGVLLDTLPYILILVVVAGGGVLLFLRKRKNDDDE